MITLRQLEALRFVIKYETVTEASKMMHLSQPAMSQLISNLEYETGLVLFHRERRRLYPTEEAILLSRHAEEIFTGLRHVERVSRQIRNKKSGRLHLASVMMLGRQFLPALLADFLAEKPDVEASFWIESQGSIRDLVSGRRCDLGYCFWGKPHPGIKTMKSYRFPLVCVMPINDPLVTVSEVAAADLQERMLVRLNDGSRTQEAHDRFFEQEGVGYDSQVSVQQTEVACELVSRGHGVAIVNPFAAAEYESRGKLVIKPFRSPLETELCSITPVGKAPSLIAQEFLETVDLALMEFDARLRE